MFSPFLGFRTSSGCVDTQSVGPSPFVSNPLLQWFRNLAILNKNIVRIRDTVTFYSYRHVIGKKTNLPRYRLKVAQTL